MQKKEESGNGNDDAQELIDDPGSKRHLYSPLLLLHTPTYAIMAMKAGKPAYIEKPMAVTYEECTRINVFLRKRVFPVSSHITAAISPTFRK